jgi:hypothetical protein
MRLRCLALIAIVFCFVAAPAMAADLVLKRVMLSTSGVGYFEYEAEVTGDAALTLEVPLSQIDDILKSIVVYDSSGGVGSASLAGRDPLDQLFRDLPFGAEALASPAALLNALQGAEIRVESSRSMTGKLLQVLPETVQLGDRGTTTRHRVSVMTSAGMQQFILEDADSVTFTDPGLQAKVDKALSEIAAHREKNKRQIVLTTHGAAQRTVRVGYVVGAPLWKASFRLTLPQGTSAAKAHLQGWAVLENMSGQDWKAVDLTLLSGDPVSFRQAIYESYYVDRPEVPVKVAGRILPKPDTGVMVAGESSRDDEPRKQDETERSGSRLLRPNEEVAGIPADALGILQNHSQKVSGKDPNQPGSAAQSKFQSDTAEAEERTVQIAFRLPQALTILSGQSTMVPILDRDLPMERLALFQPGTSVTHPLASVRLTNDSPAGLPTGVLTLYEETGAGVAYVGDAQIAGLPPGETRLVSYAIDNKTKVVREDKRTQTLSKGTIAQGVLTLTRTQRLSSVYRVAAPAAETRKLIIEHPKLSADWTLVEPSGADVTASSVRTTLELKAGETKDVAIAFETPVAETLRIADMDESQIAEVTDSQHLDPAIKRAFTELARLRRILAEKQATEAQIKDKIAALHTDQERIRETLAKVERGEALHNRYLTKLGEQETQLETLETAADRAAEEVQAASTAVNDLIAKLGT